MRSDRSIAVLSGALLIVSSCFAVETAFDYSADPIGSIPSGFSSLPSGKGGRGSWMVIEDPQAPSPSKRSVVQNDTSDPRLDHYALLISNHGKYRNVSVTVPVMIVPGSKEGSAGVVVRFRDGENYYVLEMSQENGAVSFYRIRQGRRETLARVFAKIAGGSWHVLGIKTERSRAECFFDGQPLFSESVSDLPKGKVGFWTRSNTVARFADIEIISAGEESAAERIKEILQKTRGGSEPPVEKR